MWPRFIWGLFTNENIQQRHGAKIWKFIPQTFMYWWIDTVQLTITTLADMTIESLSLYFDDRIKDHNIWKDDIQSGLLSRLTNI